MQLPWQWRWGRNKTGMKLLVVSDVELPYLCCAPLKERFPNIDLVISCGDLSSEYLAYISDALNAPLYYVFGNHQGPLPYDDERIRKIPQGTDIDQKCVVDQTGLILAGVQGSLQYNYGHYQYTQLQMWLKVLAFVPTLLHNKIKYGRYLDVLVSHAPAWQLLDAKDWPHRGSKAFRWLIDTFKPMLHVFGHIHLLRQDAKFQMNIKHSLVMNTYGYREIEIIPPRKGYPYPRSGMLRLVRKGF
jgi:predicted phosphodiesterase